MKSLVELDCQKVYWNTNEELFNYGIRLNIKVKYESAVFVLCVLNYRQKIFFVKKKTIFGLFYDRSGLRLQTSRRFVVRLFTDSVV